MTSDMIDRYLVLEKLGQGGMAVVYRARDPRFERDVAIKVLPREFLHDPSFRERFEREAKIIAQLEHGYIVPVYDFGEHDGQPYLVMRYMAGGSLAERIKTEGSLSLAETQIIISRVTAALEAAHSWNMIHRDVKPGNVLFDPFGEAYLSDFGIVKLSEATAQLTGSGIIGTPAYMAPEMSGKGGTTPLIDVYALGVTTYQMLTGRLPFEADTPMGLLMAHLGTPVPNILDLRPDLPEDTQAVIDRVMAKDPTYRYQSPVAFAEDLARLPAGGDETVLASATRRASIPSPIYDPEAKTVKDPVDSHGGYAGETRQADAGYRDAGEPLPVIEIPPRRRGLPGWVWIAGVAVAAVLVIGGLFLTGVLGGGAGSGAGREPAEEPVAGASSAEEPAAAGPVVQPNCPDEWGTDFTPELLAACDGELSGTTVTISGPLEEARFNQSVADFEALTGIDLVYIGTVDEAGSGSDIVDFPTPTELLAQAEAGRVLDLTDVLNQDWLHQNYKQAWLDMAEMPDANGNMIQAGIWARFNGKSQIWYAKDDFEAAGYQIPETWDDLMALQERMVADGRTPWCIGIGSDAATGWPATDWIEDIMLRTTSLENYDRWSLPRGDMERLPFASPEVRTAVEIVSGIWFDDAFVYGGRASITSTDFRDAFLPMFDDPPGCYLHKQGNFITTFFPEGVEAGVDYDFFYLPSIDSQYGRPYLIAGDLYAMSENRPEVVAAMDFFSRGASLRGWLADGGTLSPHNDTPLDWYGDEVDRKVADSVRQADSVRFDGSDLMPGPVGNGSFWARMTEYVNGEIGLDEALEEIDAAWPE